MRRAFCEGCLEKQRRIDQLLEENQRLQAQLRYRQRQATEGFFGSSTPSAQRPVKATSPPEHQGKPGGAQPGHPGHGRRTVEAAAAQVIEVPVAPRCPACGGLPEYGTLPLLSLFGSLTRNETHNMLVLKQPDVSDP